MEIVMGTKDLSKKFNNPVITIGNFDGIHLGHQEIFKEVKQRALELEGDSIVYTFEPHPLNVLNSQKTVSLITSFSEKMKLIEESGIDIVICEDFTPEYASLSASQFVEDILIKKIGIRAIFVGHDYAFGKGREGNIELLKQFGKEADFEVFVVDVINIDDGPVSSTRIRDLIQRGEVKKVARFLGRDYSISGKVGKGKSRGKGLGFPTANLESVKKLFPKPGIYVVRVFLEDHTLQGVANIGFKPTFGDETLTIEVFILDFDKDIYGESISVCFVERLRDEKAFESSDELVRQIKEDVKRAREILA
ncbi:MAG: bifunctional riboflavin kinase/FAD synthetase [Thermodesulfobacteriota bacterium]|nr:bifunctional riboflavin kinase/FAD synthetase [Thermodesulfobacteriota bacterium]